MKICNTCGQPITRGHCGSDASGTICLVCWTERTMRSFRYPASQTKQRALRNAAQARRRQRGDAGQQELDLV